LGVIGLIVSLIAFLFLMIGLLPFMGWFNWFTTLPAALLGIIISGLAIGRRRTGTATAGLIISLIVIVLSVGRLILGGGVF
jgi:hypothetical protein